MKYSTEYDELFKKYVEEVRCPFSWLQIKAQAIAESNLDPDAVSHCGAVGIMQIMPETGEKDLGISIADLKNPDRNIWGGIEYMRRMEKSWKCFPILSTEVWAFSLASYNAGIGNMRKAVFKVRSDGHEYSCWSVVAALGLPKITGDRSEETINYVARTMRIYQELKKNNTNINDGGESEPEEPRRSPPLS